MHLAISCAWYWLIRDRNEEAREWFEIVAPLAADVDGDEARVLSVINVVVESFSDGVGPEFTEVSDAMRESLASLEEIEPRAGEQRASATGRPHDRRVRAGSRHRGLDDVGAPAGGRRTRARPVAERRPAHRARGRRPRTAARSPSSAPNPGHALDLFTELGDVWGIALSEQMHSLWLAVCGRLEEALELSDSSTEHMRMITTSWDLAQQQGLAIQMLLRLGRRDEAPRPGRPDDRGCRDRGQRSDRVAGSVDGGRRRRRDRRSRVRQHTSRRDRRAARRVARTPRPAHGLHRADEGIDSSEAG